MTRVVIVGAGPGGLEAALALRGTVGCDFDVHVVAESPQFVYRPMAVTTPFGHGPAVEIDMRELAADRGFAFTVARLEGVDADSHTILTSAGEIAYDALILATGATRAPVVMGALSFGGPADAAALTAALAACADGERVCFVATASSVWSLPVYELALQTAVAMRDEQRDVRIALVTAEPAPLADLGPKASGQVADLLAENAIEVFLHTIPEAFDSGHLYVPMAGAIEADVVVALPALVGRRIPGVSYDGLRFVPVDDYCRVRGLEDVFAIGDMTDRRLKQGGLATQQADVVAAVLAERAGAPGEVSPYEPVLRVKLVTGGEPLFLRYPEVDVPRPDESFDALWWPPHKIAGRYLGPYLASHGELMVTPR